MDFQYKYESLASWAKINASNGCPDLPESLFFCGLLASVGIPGHKSAFFKCVIRRKKMSGREMTAFAAIHISNKNAPTRKLLEIYYNKSLQELSFTERALIESLLDKPNMRSILFPVALLISCFLAKNPKEQHYAAIMCLVARKAGAKMLSKMCARILTLSDPHNLLAMCLAEKPFYKIASMFWERVPWSEPAEPEVWSLETSRFSDSWDRSCCWDFIFLIKIIREIYSLS